MKWLYAIIAVLTFLTGYYSIKKKRDLRHDSQFWFKNLDCDDDIFASIEIHFPSMMMKYSFKAIGDKKSLTFFHVQRRGEGPWEMKLTNQSWLRALKEQDRLIETGAFSIFQEEQESKEQLHKMKRDGNIWQTMGDWFDPSLETAYQRFIHTPDVPIAPLSWTEEDRTAGTE